MLDVPNTQERDYVAAIRKLSPKAFVQGFNQHIQALEAKGFLETAAWARVALAYHLRQDHPGHLPIEALPDFASLEHIPTRGGLLALADPLGALDNYIRYTGAGCLSTIHDWDIVMVYHNDPKSHGNRITGPIQAGKVDWNDNVAGYRLGWARAAIPYDANDVAHQHAVEIGRVEVTVDYYLDQMCDESLWLWKGHNLEHGMDPWQYFMDLPVEPEVVKERGMRIFVQIKDMPHRDK